MEESLDTGAQGGKVDGTVAGKEDGSSYKLCERKGGR